MTPKLTKLLCTLMLLSAFYFQAKTDDCILALESGYPIITTPRCDSPDGMIEISAVGTGEILYQLDNQTPQSDGLFEDLPTGTYVITITDEDDCEIQITVPLEGQQSIEIGGVSTIDSECDEATGIAQINADGSGLTYSLNGTDFQSGNQFTGLSGGVYTAYVRDAFECVETVEFTIVQGSIELLSQAVTHTTCYESSGVITVEAEGDNLEFRLVGFTDWQENSIFSNLSTGLYNLEIRDEGGCVLSKQYRVKDEIDYEIVVELPVCGETDGSILITVFTPGEYEYSIDGGDNYYDDNFFDNLPEGAYPIRIRLKGTDCYFNTNRTITPDPQITVGTIDAKKPICGDDTGHIIVPASGEGLVFTLTSDDLEIVNETGEFYNLSSGQYSIRIDNSLGCYVSRNVNLQDYNDIDLNDVSATITRCDSEDGTILVDAESSLGGELTYSIDGESYSSESFFEGLLPGPYTVYIQSSNGCQVETTVSVPAFDPIIVTSLPTSVPSSSCSEDGSITIIATGGGALEYSLDNQNWQSGHIFSGLNPGVYVVYVRAENGCTYNTGDITLPSNFSLDGIDIDDVYCENQVGNVTVRATGTQLEYKLNDGEYQSESTFTDLGEGEYTIYVRDLHRCVLEESFEIKALGGVDITDYDLSYPTCENNNAEVTIFAETLSESLEYWIEGGTPSPEPTFGSLGVGSYTFYVRDNYGCTDSISVSITEVSEVTHHASSTDYVCFQHPGSITVTHTGGLAPFVYSLDGITYQDSNVFTDLEEGNYTVHMIDRVGCPSTIDVVVEYQCQAMVPNAITPDANQKNDRLVLLHERNLKINAFRVYNGWGDLVYEKFDFWSQENEEEFWAGVDINQEGGDQNVFLYHVSFQDVDETTKTMEGIVHLVR